MGNGSVGRICNLWVGGDLGTSNERQCTKQAVVHIFWTDEDAPENSYACATHKGYALRTYGPWRVHDLQPCCGMPGALFFPEENVCRYEGDELPVVEVEREEEEILTPA